ncbi:unnamed protein product [Lampetra planeri]
MRAAEGFGVATQGVTRCTGRLELAGGGENIGDIVRNNARNNARSHSQRPRLQHHAAQETDGALADLGPGVGTRGWIVRQLPPMLFVDGRSGTVEAPHGVPSQEERGGAAAQRLAQRDTSTAARKEFEFRTTANIGGEASDVVNRALARPQPFTEPCWPAW